MDFGEYSLRQYRYAKDYYKIVQTELGIRKVEATIIMHTVKRAIIMAAGIGKRMQPVTFETPKPLITSKRSTDDRHRYTRH